MDVSSLFTNIPHEDGISCVRQALQEETNDLIHTEFILRLLELLLHFNIFEFQNNLYRQEIGASMGSKPSPPYSDIFMAQQIDTAITYLADLFRRNMNLTMLLLKRFLDDLFMIFIGSTKVLHIFLSEVNKINPNIKMTMSHTSVKNEPLHLKCDCETKYSIPYLDTSCEIRKGKIETDLYRKPTDRNQYLLTSSCHPVQCINNIPFSLALRINRICSEYDSREKRFSELRELLLARRHKSGVIIHAILKARNIPRESALTPVVQPQSERQPIFVVTFDTRLPSIPSILNKHWRAIVAQDQYMSEVFPNPPITAIKRQRNLKKISSELR